MSLVMLNLQLRVCYISSGNLESLENQHGNNFSVPQILPKIGNCLTQMRYCQ
jgi:hypothetical protein